MADRGANKLDSVIPPCEKSKVSLQELTKHCLGCFPIEIADTFERARATDQGYLSASYSEDRKRLNCCVFRELPRKSKLQLVVRFSMIRPAFKQLATLTET